MNEFLTLRDLKESLEITNSDNDHKLVEILDDANLDVCDKITKYLTLKSLDSDSKVALRAKVVVKEHAKADWYTHVGEHELAKSADKKYKKMTKLLIKDLEEEAENNKPRFFVGPRPDVLRSSSDFLYD